MKKGSACEMRVYANRHEAAAADLLPRARESFARVGKKERCSLALRFFTIT